MRGVSARRLPVSRGRPFGNRNPGGISADAGNRRFPAVAVGPGRSWRCDQRRSHQTDSPKDGTALQTETEVQGDY